MAKQSLRKVAYDYLYDGIISNRLPLGSSIVEQEISDALGISRTPVREALKQLIAEGLVTYLPGRGTFVAQISKSDIEEIFELREIFEELALKTAVYEITDDEIAEMGEILQSLDGAVPETFYNCDRKLHEMIIRHGHNRRMVRFLNTVNSQIEMFRRISAMTPNRLRASREEHMELLQAIKERNLDKAIQELKIHLLNVKKSTISICERMSIDSKEMQ